jgi:rRNA maturation protein Nop10
MGGGNKVRCQACGKVVKLGTPATLGPCACPECGAVIGPRAPATLLNASIVGGRQDGADVSVSDKGVIRTRDRGTEIAGVIVVVLVLMISSSVVLGLWEGSSGAAVVVGIVGIVATILVGRWFEGKSRR